MFKKKNALLALAITTLLAACGGGGGGDSGAAPAPTANNNTNQQPAPTNPGNQGGNNNVSQPDQTPMQGYLLLASNFIKFTTSDEYAIQTTTPQFALDSEGAGEFREGINAPIEAFGFRIDEIGMQPGETKVVRMAFELDETAASVAQFGGQAEKLRLMVDQVELRVGANGKLESVSVPATAKLYINTVNTSGAAVDAVVNAVPSDLVSLGNVTGDSTTKWLNLNIEQAVTLARTAAPAIGTSVKDFEGRFVAKATISNVVIRGADSTPATEDNPVLTGDDITITGQPAVKGYGVKGLLKIKVYGR